MPSGFRGMHWRDGGLRLKTENQGAHKPLGDPLRGTGARQRYRVPGGLSERFLIPCLAERYQVLRKREKVSGKKRNPVA